MNIIVPLAGPDFELADGRVKAELEFGGRPLLRAAIESRAWWREGQVAGKNFIFVLRSSPASRRFAEDSLAKWYPGAQIVQIGSGTKGAALTVLAGLAVVQSPESPICIDLADILFQYRSSSDHFNNPDVDAVAFTFKSRREIYSYLSLDECGFALLAKEKEVISDNASAGVYLFRSGSVYMRALSHVLEKYDEYSHNGLCYVCPVMNGIVSRGRLVKAVEVSGVVDIKAPD